MEALQGRWKFVVVDEVQDVNPVQCQLIRSMVGETGCLTAVGDQRQSIFAFRGAQIKIMGNFYAEFESADYGEVVKLRENFRSTRRIIDLANEWSNSISVVGNMIDPPMEHGKKSRIDYDASHVGVVNFSSRELEADWIARKISCLVKVKDLTGSRHDSKSGDRGITYGDVAILVRSSADARSYREALDSVGVPSIVKAGPDLFSQPEVMLFVGVLGIIGGNDSFYESKQSPKMMGNRVRSVLGCDPDSIKIVKSACDHLRQSGVPMDQGAAELLVRVGKLIKARLSGEGVDESDLPGIRSPQLRAWLLRKTDLRRIFPQKILHWIFGEAKIDNWDANDPRCETALFHAGQLSSLMTSVEMPGWSSPKDFKYQVISLINWGCSNARANKPELLVPPNAVTITTVHSAKGLQWPVVFLADVNSLRFPSKNAKSRVDLPFDGPISEFIDPSVLSDNDNYDGERRLMYVALTRAERYLVVSRSGKNVSKFFKEISKIARNCGAVVTDDSSKVLCNVEYFSAVHDSEGPLATSFSDLRYYWQCPHDFYLRKVLGFAPAIDQAFGYGKGIHNLMRAIHTRSSEWAEIANDRNRLESELSVLFERGLFYLRYTTEDPERKMRAYALDVVANYIQRYSNELSRLRFEPEREFETLIADEDVLVSGAIDLVRLDNPPSVTLVDFKSGQSETTTSDALDKDEMALQIGLYGLAAKHELEYEPNLGLVRYLGEKNPELSEMKVSLDDEALHFAQEKVKGTAVKIRNRRFDEGPSKDQNRCKGCDFIEFCGRAEARRARASR